MLIEPVQKCRLSKCDGLEKFRTRRGIPLLGVRSWTVPRCICRVPYLLAPGVSPRDSTSGGKFDLCPSLFELVRIAALHFQMAD